MSDKPARKPREKRRTRAEVDAIIGRIANDMAAGKWVSGPSSKRYAEECEVTRDTIRHWATQASRIVSKGSDDEIATLKVSTLARLDVISVKAEAKGNFQAAVNALDKVADIAGLKVPIERRISIAMENIKRSEEWGRLRGLLVAAAARFKDPDDRIILLDAIDEFDGTPKQLVEAVVVEASEVT